VTPTRNRSTGWIAAAVVLTALVFFALGISVGLYHWPPFSTLKHVQDATVDAWKRRTLSGPQRLMDAAFTDPLPDGEQVYPPVTTPDGIRHAQQSMLLPVDRFYTAYDSMELLGAERLTLDRGKTQLCKVAYRLAGRDYEAFAYVANAAASQRTAVLVIPGTGLNQSSAIYGRDRSNYQADVMKACGPSSAVFVFIKPNEDCVAIHSAGRKLNQGFFLNWLLSAGGSYSAHYIANSLAVTRYLQDQYPTVAVVGLSQGGYAALLNALQSQPDLAVIASAYSVGMQDMPSRHDQILIPGLRLRLTDEVIRARMRASRTRFLFTYGTRELGQYGLEATQHRTCEYFAGLANVECRSHEQGHTYPVNLVREFLAQGNQLE
jgi:hypothetical protein